MSEVVGGSVFFLCVCVGVKLLIGLTDTASMCRNSFVVGQASRQLWMLVLITDNIDLGRHYHVVFGQKVRLHAKLLWPRCLEII